MNSRTTQSPIRITLLLILLLAFALRLYHLDFQELRGDEAFGYFFSLRPLADLIPATIELKEPHPVASYFVQHVWLGWAGHSEFALRFLNVWFGTLAVALLYRLGRRLELTLPACYAAIFFFAISPYAIWHSQDARMYSMSLALTLASTWLAVEWLPKQRWPQAVAYMAVSWLALHTHYFSIFVLLAQSVFVLSRALLLRRMWLTVSSWLTLQGLLGLLYLPWVARVGDILTGYGGNGDSPRFLAMLSRSLSVFAMGESVPATQRVLWAGLASVLLLIGGLHLARNGPAGRRTLWLLALYLAVPLGVTWYSAQQRPIFNERYLIAAAPPFYLLLGAAFNFGRAPKGHPTWIHADKNRLISFVSALLLLRFAAWVWCSSLASPLHGSSVQQDAWLAQVGRYVDGFKCWAAHGSGAYCTKFSRPNTLVLLHGAGGAHCLATGGEGCRRCPSKRGSTGSGQCAADYLASATCTAVG